jgi:L-2-hydroxyglutarate oxidase LhgO
MMEADELRDIEPHARAARALYSPHTAIVNYSAVAAAMAAQLARRGVQIITSAAVRTIARRSDGLVLNTDQ